MKYTTRLRLLSTMILILSVSVSIILNCGPKPEKITIKGSTTVLPITLKAIDAYAKLNRAVAISVDGSGSGNGIKALLDGSCDIANSSRSMKKEELEKAKLSGLAIKEIIVAYDMIVPIVNPSNPISNLSKNQLKAVYDGSLVDWSDLGGEKGGIVVISRDTSSGTYEYWHEDVMKKSEVRKDALLQASSGALMSAVSNNRRAIAYVGFGYLNKAVKSLRVNGIEPSIESGKSGKYPISRPLYIYVNEKRLSEETGKFIDFLLSENGQSLVRDAGFIPIR